MRRIVPHVGLKRIFRHVGMSSAAARQRQYRERVASGRVKLTVEVDIVEWTEGLIAAGLLQGDPDDRQAVVAATERVLELLPKLDVMCNGAALKDPVSDC